MRTLLCSVIALLFCATGLQADEIQATVKKIDAEKNTITVSIGDKDTTYSVAKDCPLLSQVGRRRRVRTVTIEGGLKSVDIGSRVALTIEKRDDQQTVTQIRYTGITSTRRRLFR